MPPWAWAIPRDVTGVQWSLAHRAVCNAAFKEAIQGLQKAFPKSVSLCSAQFHSSVKDTIDLPFPSHTLQFPVPLLGTVRNLSCAW